MAGIFNSKRLGFLLWGIRYDNIIFFTGFPVLGILFSMSHFSLRDSLKPLILVVLQALFYTQLFAFNDWGDAQTDPAEPASRNWHALKHPEVVSGEQVAAFCLILSLVSIAGIFYLSRLSGLLMLGAWLVSLFYSHPRLSLKKFPGLTELAHLAFAALPFLASWNIFQQLSGEAFILAGFFGVVLASGNIANQVEHFDQELGLGLRTSTIFFGKRPAYRLSVWMFFLSACALFGLAMQGLVSGWIKWPSLFLMFAWPACALVSRKWDMVKEIKKFRALIRVVYLLFSLILIAELFWNKR